MPIVPVYRLRATPSDPDRRYRFSRDARPNRNPTPGEPNPDPESRWFIDRVAFYAWSDPRHDDQTVNDQLVPVYEFYRLGADGLVFYRYSTEAEPPPGWISREYVAFWMYPARAANAGAPVFVYSQATSEDRNYALSITRDLPDPWTNESVLGMAAATIPIEASVRRGAADRRRFHWSYTPSTINIAYPITLRFEQSPQSAWRFTDLEIVNGREDFDAPIVTDSRVLVEARYANPGRDFKYRVTVDVFSGPGGLVSDADVETVPDTRASAAASAVSDPEIRHETTDEL